ncbi:MAG TPA: hypothetical protein VFI20_04010 [Terracidiphilus sp.]|nr:hypothetical protein [Terracidiphilus sp.]
MVFLGILALGTLAFSINAIFGWSGFGRAKNPEIEFGAQAALFLAFALVVLVHAEFFREARWRSRVVTLMAWAAVVHLVIFLLEATHLFSPASLPLELFRTTSDIGRPSGLMSEPSYFGAFAGLYGGPLLLVRSVPHYRWRCVLAIALFACAVIIRAKTFVPVMICEFCLVIWMRGRSVLKLRYLPIAIAVVLISLYVIIANAALDLQDNLSSVMRIGSAQLASNVAIRGYGLTGIGFGQFHYFFRPQFAPSYLFLSSEAREQFSLSATMRASTYNFFIRMLLETGIVGLLLFTGMIYSVLRSARNNLSADSQLGIFLLAGSLGFLFTQDPYFYPPLALALAILLGRIGTHLDVKV